MKSTKNSSKLLVACVALVSIVAFLKASYYQADFFPIGLTGLNGTGSGKPNPTGCPYGNVLGQNWSWDGDTSEQNLVFDLGINCLGSEDARPDYLVDLKPSSPSEYNYLHKVCMFSFMDDGDSANPEHIYVVEFIDITELIDSLLIDSLPGSLDLED